MAQVRRLSEALTVTRISASQDISPKNRDEIIYITDAATTAVNLQLRSGIALQGVKVLVYNGSQQNVNLSMSSSPTVTINGARDGIVLTPEESVELISTEVADQYVTLRDRIKNVSSTDTDLIIGKDDKFINLLNITADRTITLPNVQSARNKQFIFTNRNGSIFNWKFSSNIINHGVESFNLMPQKSSFILRSDGSNWVVVASDIQLFNTINNTTSEPTKEWLNSQYTNRLKGFRVFAPTLTSGGKIYTKLDNTTTGDWSVENITLLT